MDFNVTKRLEIDNKQGDFLEIEQDNFIIIQFINGTYKAVQVQEIKEYSIIVLDDSDNKLTFFYEEIEDIEFS